MKAKCFCGFIVDERTNSFEEIGKFVLKQIEHAKTHSHEEIIDYIFKVEGVK
jgi:hypothetical protein